MPGRMSETRPTMTMIRRHPLTARASLRPMVGLVARQLRFELVLIVHRAAILAPVAAATRVARGHPCNVGSVSSARA